MGQPDHILVVDDDDDVRDVIVSILREYHYRVSSVSGGASMRDFLETNDTVDCVILDAVMPGELSISLLAHLKERNNSVVIISGNPDSIKYAEDNGLQLLQKPFRAQELHSSVHTAIASGSTGSDRWMLVDQKREE
jgi:DNA-binding NtrC family response regulator